MIIRKTKAGVKVSSNDKKDRGRIKDP